MLGRLWKRPGFVFPFVMSLVLVIAVACGGSDEPAAKSQPAATSAAAVTAPATEAPAPIATLAPGVVPTATPEPVAEGDIPGEGETPISGGVVAMQAFEPPGSDTYYGASNQDNTLLHIGPVFNQVVEYDPHTRDG